MAFYKGAAKEAQRAAQLAKQREKDRQDIEIQKRKLEMEMRIGDIDNKFARHYDAVEQKLKSDTVGLVTLHEMRAKQEAVVTAREKQIAAEKEALARLEEQLAQEKKNAAKLQRNVLSFSMDAEEDEFDDDIPPLSRAIDTKVDLTLEIKTEEETVNHTTKNLAAPQSPLSAADDNSSEHGSSCNEQSNDHPPKKRKRLGMNPSVDTSFLPDIDREEEELRLREELRRKWMDQQNSLKEEDILITYSFWDGSGHRRQVRMKKGHSIAQFLQRCLDQCRKEFPELRSANHDQLMYVKEDLIIPQHYTFYDFIVTKARGKSGPLFVFDAHEDVRVRSDATVAKDESHAGKVCLRSWYERNKHIFPASRWEPYDPMKNWDEYSISDKLAAKIVVK